MIPFIHEHVQDVSPLGLEQRWLLPPTVHDFVPPGRPTYCVRETVREGLDPRENLSACIELWGCPPCHPTTLVALLLYGHSRGVYVPRQLARAGEERLDRMAVTGLQRPDFRTIADFCKRHLGSLARLCRAAGLMQLEQVALATPRDARR